MKRILTAIVLIPIVLLIVLRAPLWVVALAVALVAFLATREYLDIIEHYGIKPFRKIALCAAIVSCALPTARSLISTAHRDANSAIVPFFFAALQSISIVNVLLLTLPLWFLGFALRSRDLKQALPQAALTSLAYFYVALPYLS